MKPNLEKIISGRSFYYFTQLAENMNYTQTARLLGISQPALTQQIKRMEASIGAPLFYSVGRKLYLTEAGKTMQKTITEIENLLTEASDAIQKDKSEVSGKITIGISASIEEKVFTDFLVEYYKKFPSVRITLIMVNRKEVWKSLEEGKIDIAILYVPEQLIENWTAYEAKRILKDELLFLHHDETLADKKSITYEEAAQKEWVTYPKSYFVSQVISSAFKHQKTTLPKTVAHFTKPIQMFKFSNATAAYTALPKSFFQAHKYESKLKAIPFEPAIDMDLSFVFRKETRKVPRIEHFLASFDLFLEDEDYISRLKK